MNPLLQPSFNKLPFFGATPGQFQEAIETLLAENRQILKQCLAEEKNYTWDGLLFPLEQMEAKLGDVFNTLSHIISVKNSKELYQVYQDLLAKLSIYHTEIMQNKELSQAILTVTQREDYLKLDSDQKRVIQNWLKEFELSGVNLPDEAQSEIKQLTVALSDLESRFEQNVLESTESWRLTISNPEELKGLPARDLTLAQERSPDGSAYILTLDFPCYWSVMTHVENRDIRERMYRAYTTRASDKFSDPQWDNSAIMVEILCKRERLSKLLGFENYAEYALQTRMLKKTEIVQKFLQELLDKVKDKAKTDFQELQNFAQREFSVDKIQAWDIGFFSEKLLQDKLHLSEELLREYFPLNKVLKGLFKIAERLYGIQIKEIDGFDTWDKHARLFAIHDRAGELRGHFYTDFYSRSNKQGGAWVANGKTRMRNAQGELQYPATYLATNVSSPVAGQESLLSHDEVVTLFHEFGHCLHHTITTVDHPSISGGSGVEWDAIECPSQMMENWCWEQEALELITEHVKTKETLPPELFAKLKSYRHFQIGLGLIRQLEYGLLDFALHTQSASTDEHHVQEVLAVVRTETGVIPVPEYNRVSNTFGHVFSGEYAAGYYSYLWSEVLSCDAYAAFVETGNLFNTTVAQSFLTKVLESGGTRDFIDLFKDFRGREPETKALLQQLFS